MQHARHRWLAARTVRERRWFTRGDLHSSYKVKSQTVYVQQIAVVPLGHGISTSMQLMMSFAHAKFRQSALLIGLRDDLHLMACATCFGYRLSVVSAPYYICTQLVNVVLRFLLYSYTGIIISTLPRSTTGTHLSSKLQQLTHYRTVGKMPRVKSMSVVNNINDAHTDKKPAESTAPGRADMRYANQRSGGGGSASNSNNRLQPHLRNACAMQRASP